MNVFEGDALDFPLDFKVGGSLVAPDEGSAHIVVHGHDGTKITDEPAVGSSFTLDAQMHGIALGRLFEKRIIVLTFRVNGKLYSQRTAYRVTPFVSYSASADDVRHFIGVSDTDLPDAAVDLFKAYTALVDRVGQSQVTEALNSGTRSELAANDALTMLATLDVIPSLMQRVPAMEADGVLQYRRNSVKDFRELEGAAKARLETALSELATGPAGGGTYQLISKITDTDPITGE